MPNHILKSLIPILFKFETLYYALFLKTFLAWIYSGYLFTTFFKAPALDSADAGDLTDALCEFDAVLADFASPFHERHFRYEEHLERMKRRSSASVSDSSGFSDSESAESLYRNSFSFSDEKLNFPTDSTPALLCPSAPARKAKLGDTKELEDFIADLDRTLASM